MQQVISRLDKRVSIDHQVADRDERFSEIPFKLEDVIEHRPWRELLMQIAAGSGKSSQSAQVSHSSFFSYVMRRMTDRGFFDEIPSELSVSSPDFKVYCTRLCSLIARARFCTEDTFPKILHDLKLNNNHIH